MVAFLMAPVLASAEVNMGTAPDIGTKLSALPLAITIANNLISLAWIIFGAFSIIMFIYAGFLYLNAKGDPGDVKSARNALIWGMVGVAVGLLAQALPYAASAILGF